MSRLLPGWSGAKWDRFPTSRPPSRPPTAVRAGGPPASPLYGIV